MTTKLFKACGPCSVDLHWNCLTDGATAPVDTSGNNAYQCVCAAEDHETFLHPGLTGRVFRTERTTVKGPMREVDYELEPYETRTQLETGATKNKPRDDLDAAVEVRTKYVERQLYGRF